MKAKDKVKEVTLTLNVDKLRELTPEEADKVVGAGSQPINDGKCSRSAI